MVMAGKQDPKGKAFHEGFLVVDAVHAELAELAKRDERLARSATAMAALALARELDSYGNSATSKSNCAKELRETMASLWALAPKTVEVSPLDEIKKRRDAKLGGSKAAPRVRATRKTAS